MFDILNSKLTPSLARQLIRYSAFRHIELDPEILQVAQTQLEQTEQAESNRVFLQGLADNKLRGMVLDNHRLVGLHSVLAHLKKQKTSNVVIVVASMSKAQKELSLIRQIFPDVRVEHWDRYTPNAEDTVLFLANHWAVTDYSWIFYTTGPCLVFMPTSLPLDSSSLANICQLVTILHGESFYQNHMAYITKEAPKERLLELLELFGVFSSHNCVDI